MSERPLSLEDQLALQRLNHDFAYFLDHNQVERLVALFTADAYYRHGERVREGKQEIEELFQKRKSTGNRVARHVISGLRLQRSGENTATGCSVVVTWAANSLVPVSGATPHLVADFLDEYRHDDNVGWRISRRQIERIFVAPDNTGPVGA